MQSYMERGADAMKLKDEVKSSWEERACGESLYIEFVSAK